jgi:hypothetical protein
MSTHEDFEGAERERIPDPDEVDATSRPGGDTDKDPDVTGKSDRPEHNTLTMRGDEPNRTGQAGPSRLDATRGPTTRPAGPPDAE